MNKDMYVLGIHDGHVAGAILLKNGTVVAGISEERLTNIKNHAGVPVLSIQKVLDIGGIKPHDVSLVAISSKVRIIADPSIDNQSLFFKCAATAAPYFHSKAFVRLAIELYRRFHPRRDLFESLKIIGFDSVPIVYIEHHLSHAATAYYKRPWKDKTLIFTLDGTGDGVCATVSVGQGNTITRIAQSSFYDSPSDNVYSEITEYLGMKRFEHEYKVMGLAPYGNYKETIGVFEEIMRLRPSNKLEFDNRTRYYHYQLQPLFRKKLAGKRFDHVAAGAQKFFETLVCSWVREGVKFTGIHNIVASGGSFLNVKANLLIRNLPEVSRLFIYPACDDSGIAEGAAILAYIAYCKDHHISFDISPLKDIYYGQQYSKEEISQFLKDKKLYRYSKAVDSKEIAKLLAQGKIIGRFAGRDEWGPRALGNRSIMADPRNLNVIGRLNRAIKQRDFWMPFAPAILEKDQSRYVKNSHVAPYMIEAFETKEKTINDIIAAIHPADRTTRPMTVNSWNPSWQEIISEFKKITGVGAIVNTSFNLHGYPLVGTPQTALRTFESSDLDGLLFDDRMLEKRRK